MGGRLATELVEGDFTSFEARAELDLELVRVGAVVVRDLDG